MSIDYETTKSRYIHIPDFTGVAPCLLTFALSCTLALAGVVVLAHFSYTLENRENPGELFTDGNDAFGARASKVLLADLIYASFCFGLAFAFFVRGIRISEAEKERALRDVRHRRPVQCDADEPPIVALAGVSIDPSRRRD
jgi:hypothetical protein